jgi:hypothetical protein
MLLLRFLDHQTRRSKIDSHVRMIAILSHDARIVAFLSSATLQVGFHLQLCFPSKRDCFCCFLSFMLVVK